MRNLADHRDGLLSFSFSLVLDSSVGLSAGIHSATLLEIRFRRPWGQSCIQQRKTTCLLSIRLWQENAVFVHFKMSIAEINTVKYVCFDLHFKAYILITGNTHSKLGMGLAVYFVIHVVYQTLALKKIPWPRLNIKTVLSTYGYFHVKDKTAVRTSYL